MKERLAAQPLSSIVGGNIGKNKVTPNEEAVNDYLICFRELHPLVDYFVVNVSSPNTPNLRELQDKEPLKRLLETLVAVNGEFEVRRPILLKIAPDLTDSQLDDILEIANEVDIQGIVATNTTIDRADLQTSSSELEAIGNGGLSGAPLQSQVDGGYSLFTFQECHITHYCCWRNY